MENSIENPIKKIKPLGFPWDTTDPFLFCVHHRDKYPKGNKEMGPDASLAGRQIGQDFLLKDGWRMYHGDKIPGFPGHPHRGFETITVVREGMVDHADSMGASGRYGDGDVQWMTAGKGVQHSEMFPLIDQEKENPMELFQIWLNLPKKDKMVNPHFKMLWGNTIPKIKLKNDKGKSTEIEVVAGMLEGQKAPAPPPNSWANMEEHDVGIWNIKMEAGATWTIEASKPGVNRTLYFYKGNGLLINDNKIDAYHGVEVSPEVSLKLSSPNEECKILVLQGRPIKEPVVQHGPFVMNTSDEINQAFSDYQRTQFGGWPWPRRDQVHDRSKKRFAQHADGRIETRN